MQCKEVIKHIEEWAPKAIAWDRDNVGLQIGTAKRKIKNVMLSLDLNANVIEQALKKKCNFIITHHPLLFNPLTKIDTESDSKSKLVEKLIKNDVTLYSAHTNLNFTKDGVSFQLAKRLNLQNIKFLHHLNENQTKLVVFVQEDNVEKVSNAIHRTGGGIIGNYSNCSFRIKGTGTFKGTDKTNPAVGTKGKLESVDEIRLEVIVDNWKLSEVIIAMKSAHPYEEVAYDLYPLKNENCQYGMGTIGELKKPMIKNKFLDLVSKKLTAKNLRYSNGKKGTIKRVAVCGGSCSDLLSEASELNADAFITSDVKYHSFQDAEGKILFIDAGHYETEIHSIDEIQKRLKLFLNKEKGIKVFKYSGSTNPIIFYNN
ncbi:MAG: Nif3-like dinuclear metal center hexameric protein [Bacteroidetes bacterium]|nr:Nif3-like dinuclear metal center hexameric protein [Bacteroidota bacterium]